MHRLLAIFVLLASATNGARGHLLPRWATRGQLPALGQHAAPANRDEALSTFAVDTAGSKAADDTGNSVMYFIETKQELFVFGKAVPAPITSPEIFADTGAPCASTRVPATITSSPATSTSTPATSTRMPTTSTSVPATITSAPATSTRMPTTSTSVPATITSAPATSTNALTTSTSAPATSTSAPTTGTSAPSISSNALLSSSTISPVSTSEASTTVSTPTTTTSTAPPTSTIPPGYTYYAATGSSYKFHHARFVSWDVANSSCAGEGAHLVVINDEEEANIIGPLVKDAVGYYYGVTWTGLRDNRPNGVMEWRTVHGEPLSDVFHEWDVGAPHNDAEWTCAYFSAYTKRLYDAHCHWTCYFTCELPR